MLYCEERGNGLFSLTTSKGPPGTGKTTSIHALAHELLGANFKEAVLELNASDDRLHIKFSWFQYFVFQPIKMLAAKVFASISRDGICHLQT